jgi:iron complex outermembrane receptor protein
VIRKCTLVLILFNSFIFLRVESLAQKPFGSIKGKILSADSQPAAFVNVELKKLKRMTVTDGDGNFILQHLPPIADTLLISSIESRSTKMAVRLEMGSSLDIGTIHLQYRINELENVEIRGQISRSYKSDYSFFGTKTQAALKDIPQSVSTVTRELISDKMELTLKDAVTDVSGVNQYSGFDEYTIRGFRAENARNINGLRGYNTTYTSAMLVNIERIEVIKGPTATLYGNSDPGGTINLVTKKPLDKGDAEANITAGSWNHLGLQGGVTGPFNKSKTVLYGLNAGYDQTHSFRNQFYAKSFQIASSLSFIPNDKIHFNLDFSISHINTLLDRGQPGFNGDTSLKSTPIDLIATQQGDYLHETDFASVASLYIRSTNISLLIVGTCITGPGRM